jgi:hypothetical protein
MKKIILALVIFFMTSAHAHGGAHIVGKSIFDKDYKYKINNGETHYGHFYVKRSKAKRNGNENLRIEHTVHIGDNNITKRFSVKYNEKTSLLTYAYNMEGYIYYCNFYIKDNLLSGGNQGALTIYNKADNSFTLINVTLEPVLESETTVHSHQ